MRRRATEPVGTAGDENDSHHCFLSLGMPRTPILLDVLRALLAFNP
jgi:hypothetical protein